MTHRTARSTHSTLAAIGFAVLLASATGGCGGAREPAAPEPLELRGSTMGTRYHVKAAGLSRGVARESLTRRVEAELALVNAQMSTYLPDSEISRFNRHRGTNWFPVSVATATVVRAALDVSRWSGGAFDVTVGPLVDLWGFGPKTREASLPGTDALEAVRARVGWRHLDARLHPPALRKRVAALEVDLSAIAKGHGVDRLGALLEATGATAWMVEIGGEVLVRGPRPDGTPWRVGVETPRADRRAMLETLPLAGGAVATSGDYRNFFVRDGRRYGHTLDPRTARPVTHALASVTVIASTCIRADALATALMVLGPETGPALATRHDVAALFLVRTDEGLERQATPAFAAAAREGRNR